MCVDPLALTFLGEGDQERATAQPTCMAQAQGSGVAQSPEVSWCLM